MKVSLNWLSDYIDLSDITPEQLKHRFTIQSQEVEALYPLTTAKNLVVGHVVTLEAHPDADKLKICSVDVGRETLQIICGAPNVAADQRVVVALPGAVLPGGFKIENTKIRGVESSGMICSLKELGIDEKYHAETGIHVLPETAKVGEDAITVLGFDDIILDVDTKPDRPELLSMAGFAYDIAALFDLGINIDAADYQGDDIENPFKIKTETEACPSYYGAYMENITIKPSPLWLKARLIAAGIRPINNVVDITNYVMLETGQPLHAFDYDKLGSNEIVVRLAEAGERFITLDEKKRTLNKDDILITNGESPVALGGVMGGLDSEVTTDTKRILLESATFKPRNIRRTSQRLDLKSESSTRFEKGLNTEGTLNALKRACELLIKYAGAKVSKDIASFDHHKHEKRTIELSLSKLNGVLGSALDLAETKDILRRLRFPYTVDKEIFTVEAPARRPDLITYQDLIEEIGRIYDYNNLPDTLPKTVSRGGLTPYQLFKRQIRHALNGLGLNETITYSLIDKQHVHDLSRIKDIDPVTLANPLSEIHSTLIVTPLNGLIEVAAYNVNRRMDHVHVYELSKRYTVDKETELLGMLMKGPYHNHYWQENAPTNFFTIKGIIEALRERFMLPKFSYENVTLDNYHPHQTAVIKIDGTILGHVGKLHPTYAADHDLEDVFIAELDLEAFYAYAAKDNTYETVLRFPSVSRDIALVLDENITAGTILESIHEYSTTILKDAHVFDVYQGEHIETGKKSLAIRLRFEDKTGTLKTKTIDEMVKNILEALKKEHDAVLR